MIKRHHQILAGILIVQIVLAVVILWPKSPAVAEGKPLFGDLKADDIVALSIADGEGHAVQLKEADGDWVLPEASDYPAQGEKVSSFLKKVVGLDTRRIVARSGASHKRLRVDPEDFVRRIELETFEHEKRTLYLGSSPRYGAVHFRLEGQDDTYLTGDLTSFDAGAEASAWIDPAYVSIPQKDVSEIKLRNTNGTFVFEKGKEGAWAMEGLASDETLDQAQVGSLLRQASSLRMLAPLGKDKIGDYGLDDPSAVVTLETITKTVTLRVGARVPDDNSYVVKSSESSYYVKVREANVEVMVERARDDFLQKPPTPKPQAGRRRDRSLFALLGALTGRFAT